LITWGCLANAAAPVFLAFFSIFIYIYDW